MTSTNAPELSPRAPSGSRAEARGDDVARLFARLARFAAFAVALEFVGIAILSLVPGDVRPHTGLGSGQLEHALAYAIAGATIAVAFRTTRARLEAALPFALGAGVFELLQNLVPDRGPQAIDSLASLSGLATGLAAGAAAVALLVRAVRARR